MIRSKVNKTFFLKLCIICMVTISGFTFAQKINKKDEQGKKQGHWIYFGKDRPGTGFPEEGKVEEGDFKDDRKEGIWIKYHIDGKTPKLKGHQHIASGDDQFLLDDFKKAGKTMQVIPIHGLCVTTETPHSLKPFMQQRLRWIGKSSKIKDTTTLVISLVGVLYLTLFIFLLFTPFWFYVLPLKTMIDMFIFLPYLHRLNRKKITWVTPFFTCMYPIYCLVIVLFRLGMKTQWKGRSIDSI